MDGGGGRWFRGLYVVWFLFIDIREEKGGGWRGLFILVVDIVLFFRFRVLAGLFFAIGFLVKSYGR